MMILQNPHASILPSGRALWRLICLALITWFIVTLTVSVWFSQGSIGFVIYFFAASPYGYAVGGLLMLLWAGIWCLEKRTSGQVFISAMLIYLLPILLMAIGWATFDLSPIEVKADARSLIPPASTLRYFPSLIAILPLFNLLGLGLARAQQENFQKTIRALLSPPLLAGCAVAGMFLWFVATSAHWHLRQQVDLSVESIHQEEKRLTIDATVTLKQEGPYKFEAYYVQEYSPSRQIKHVKSTPMVFKWRNSNIAPLHTGQYGVQMVWDASLPSNRNSRLIFHDPVSPPTSREVIYRVFLVPDILVKEFHIHIPQDQKHD